MKTSRSNPGDRFDGWNRFNKPTTNVMKNKNLQRLGGGGLSLEAFANAKTKSLNYNPAEIKKKKEYYKNAKYLQKFSKQVKQGNKDDENETGDMKKVRKEEKKVKKGAHSLEAVYAKKHEEMEKERREREAVENARKEEKVKAECRRKDLKGKMLKKTKKGQPVMKYRIEHLLETIQRSAA